MKVDENSFVPIPLGLMKIVIFVGMVFLVACIIYDPVQWLLVTVLAVLVVSLLKAALWLCSRSLGPLIQRTMPNEALRLVLKSYPIRVPLRVSLFLGALLMAPTVLFAILLQRCSMLVYKTEPHFKIRL